jgi:hypothetical protein
MSGIATSDWTLSPSFFSMAREISPRGFLPSLGSLSTRGSRFSHTHPMTPAPLAMGVPRTSLSSADAARSKIRRVPVSSITETSTASARIELFTILSSPPNNSPNSSDALSVRLAALNNSTSRALASNSCLSVVTSWVSGIKSKVSMLL